MVAALALAHTLHAVIPRLSGCLHCLTRSSSCAARYGVSKGMCWRGAGTGGHGWARSWRGTGVGWCLAGSGLAWGQRKLARADTVRCALSVWWDAVRDMAGDQDWGGFGVEIELREAREKRCVSGSGKAGEWADRRAVGWAGSRKASG